MKILQFKGVQIWPAKRDACCTYVVLMYTHEIMTSKQFPFFIKSCETAYLLYAINTRQITTKHKNRRKIREITGKTMQTILLESKITMTAIQYLINQ